MALSPPIMTGIYTLISLMFHVSKIKPDSKASYKDFLKNKTNYVFNFQTIDRTIVLKTIIDLPNKASCGFDNLSLTLIKSIKFDILDSLTLIINQSLMSGVFPDKLKLAKVILFYKKGDSTITDNYQPIITSLYYPRYPKF